MPLALKILPDSYWVLAFAFVFGLVFGSFGNVLILRLPKDEGIGGRSRCPGCKRTLSLLEIIPVVSFLALVGKCLRCHRKISWQYPLVELASGGIFLYAFALESALLSAALLALALWLLLLIAIVDARHQVIPDALNIPFLVLAIVYGMMAPLLGLPGLAVSGGFFALQWLVSRGRWIGSGDLILGAGIGALLGRWQLVIVFLFASYIAGAAVACALLLAGRKTKKDAIAFGPFLAIGGVIALAWGERIIERLV